MKKQLRSIYNSKRSYTIERKSFVGRIRMYCMQFEIKIYRGRPGAASAGCDLISSGFAVAKLRQGMCHDFLSESDKSVKSAVISGSGRTDDIPAVSVSASTAADAVSTGRPASTTVTRYSPHHAPSYLLTSAFTRCVVRRPSLFLYYMSVPLC